MSGLEFMYSQESIPLGTAAPKPQNPKTRKTPWLQVLNIYSLDLNYAIS